MREYPTLQLDTHLSKGTACCKKIYGCKWMREYPTLQFDKNLSKGTACCKKSYGCKWT